MARLALLLLLASCSRPPVVQGALPWKAATWCMSGLTRKDGRERRAVGCFETAKLCRDALITAGKYGSLVDVVALTPCVHASHL